VKNEDEEPKEYFERNMLFVIALTIIALGIDYLAFYTLKKTNPWGVLINPTGLMVTRKSIRYCV
jgi:hypothetical protein